MHVTHRADAGLPHSRSQLWSLREDVLVEWESPDGDVVLHSRWGDVSLPRPGAVVCEALRRMSLGPVALENIVGEAPGQLAERTRLHLLLDRLQHLVVRSLGLDDARPLLSVVPLAPQSRFRPTAIPAGLPVRMSRFATLRTDGHDCHLESPLSLHRVVLHRAEAMCLIGALSRPTTPAAATTLAASNSGPLTPHALSYLAASGMVVRALSAPATETPVFDEDIDPALAGWSPVDLMFHTRSTLGRHDQDFGATYSLGQPRCPEPVVKPPYTGPAILLHRPRWEDLLAADPPLTVAMEGRRSTRDFGAEPLTAEDLGTLLYRAARVRALIVPPDGDEFSPPTASDRPYPSGGAAYELELYVSVNECAGIPRGAYHYDPRGHRLEPVSAFTAPVRELLETSRMAANLSRPAQVLITMTARFRRVSWKYSGLSYSLVLKHVGVVMQTLYLISTAMGLAACAVGSGSIEAAARAFGTDWRTESSVGEFLIGSGPDVPPPRTGPRRGVNDASWWDAATALLRADQRRAALPRTRHKVVLSLRT